MRPTDSELNILHVLWRRGPSTVRTVNDDLNDKQQSVVHRLGRAAAEAGGEVGYTTTLKIMQIMNEKGLVTRVEEGRTHLYAAAVSEADAKGALLQNFVDTTFRGSAMDLVLQALGNHEASVDELEAIKSLIAQIEQNQGHQP